MFGSDRSRPEDYRRAVVIDTGSKNTTKEETLWSKRRGTLKTPLTEPTLLEMSQAAHYSAFHVRAFVHTQRCANLTHRSLFEMRTNIDIDDRLMRRAMRSANSRTKRGAVEAGLRLLIQTRGQTGIRRLRGKIRWHGNLSRSRRGRTSS